MKNLTLRQLRYFHVLAQERHFGRAADLCAISQPALSMQIKELEHIVGHPLIERSGKELGLTGLGQEFARKTQTILQSLDDLADLTRIGPDTMAGQIRMGIIPTIAPYILPSLLQRLDHAYPNLSLQIRETQTQTLVTELTQGKLDAAILALPLSEPNLVEYPLFKDAFLLVRPEAEANAPPPPVSALHNMRLLLLEEGHCFRDQALSFCAMSRAVPHDTLDASSLTTLVQLVSAGFGITLLPEMAVRVETRAAAVAVSRFPDPSPSRNIGMIWRKNSVLHAPLEKIAAQIVSIKEALEA